MNERSAMRGPARFALAVLLFLGLAGMAAREWAAMGGGGPTLRQAIAGATGHPAVLRDRLLLDSSLAARSGGTLSREALGRLRDLAGRQPLASDPFLLAGAGAQLDGDWRRAERLYLEARNRHPRSSSARFLLADLYLRTARPAQGLVEMLALSRLEPGAVGPLGPALAGYASQPGAAALLAPLVGADPSVRQAMLIKLSEDPTNVRLVLALAPKRAPGEPYRPWEGRLIEGLIATGQFAQGEVLWTKFSGTSRNRPVNNPRFVDRQALPPFDWAFYAGSAGVVEAGEAGGLNVFHYGREPMLAARQLVRLTPGRYVLRSVSSPAPSNSRLMWKVICVDGGQLALAPLGRGPAGFAVTAGCPAQWLDLEVAPTEGGSPLEVRIAEVTIERAQR